jgi:hypothetical protein
MVSTGQYQPRYQQLGLLQSSDIKGILVIFLRNRRCITRRYRPPVLEECNDPFSAPLDVLPAESSLHQYMSQDTSGFQTTSNVVVGV